MKNVKVTVCMVVVILSVTAGQGFGLTQYTDGGTHDISTFKDYVWVDYEAPGKQTTVNLLSGGAVTTIEGYNQSRINVSGGSVTNSVHTYEETQTTISSGSAGTLMAYADSQVTIAGGAVKSLYSCDDTQVTISGGTNYMLWYNYGNCQSTMSGGKVSDLYLYGNAQLTMSGGSIRSNSGNYSKIFQEAKWIIDGSNFAIDGVPVGPGTITSILGGPLGYEPYSRTLTGILADGDVLNTQFRIGDSASIVLIPEPATLALLGLGGMALRRQVRRV